MRIVLDTNVLIAALVAHGACAELLEHCAMQHTLVTSNYILDELLDKLCAKFKTPRDEALAAMNLIRGQSELVEPSVVQLPECRDASDLHVLGTAAAGNCECLITGDKDLLVLNRFGDVEILAPADFWKFEANKR